jgi:uncharacterized protein YjbI with pentapeptide repeats
VIGLIQCAWTWRSLDFWVGTFAGALIGGLFGLIGAVLPRQRVASAARSSPPELWDPWLDDTETRGLSLPPLAVHELGSAVTPQRARVRPRGISPESGESFALEDLIQPFIAARMRGAVRLIGPFGSGKSTALRHLAAVIAPAAGATVLDHPTPAQVASGIERGLVIYTARVSLCAKELAVIHLAGWGEDEAIEYLLGVDPKSRPSIVCRLRTAGDLDRLEGNPELWRLVLDRLANDDSVRSARQALQLELHELLPSPDLRALARELGFARWTGADIAVSARARLAELPRIVHHRAPGLLLAAEHALTSLCERSDQTFLAWRLARELVRECGALLVTPEYARAFDALSAEIHGPGRSRHAMAVSLWHAATAWEPEASLIPCLASAYLERASWRGRSLAGAELDRADLREAELSETDLTRARMVGTVLENAQLRGACLADARLELAVLTRACLESARADRASFRNATLQGANLHGASLRRAQFHGANLTGARLTRADLWRASFEGATIDEVDFAGAVLDDAKLANLPLKLCRCAGARFAGADLTGSDLEGMSLPNANLEDARLEDAILTASTFAGANFLGANLKGAKLADVAWAGACLRDTDLSGATFHMGSSRSGLVGSPIACEGSRTGFYTDDYHDLEVKDPAEIRKADLRRVDLRGANLKGVDFYLVDLRGSRLGQAQAAHIRRCGGIL